MHTPSDHLLNMQDQSHISTRTLTTWCLVTLLILQQVSAGPVPQPDVPAGSVQNVLKRVVRMTPLWRIMGTKPFGAYCQNNYECSTGTCRRGHCSFNQSVQS
ncbi:liver-expressed antimicrobial peptide 2 [Clupea harengus]|uniref:Liver-expressed antimicrobial peptide 2 n=1 Tax=Clupea harengus TaxID=7950 RepID=A0A6P3VIN9_CLUHA|nr:liver-expressed antimicrobial peptide 2 [Clupea harengus]